MLNQVKVSTLTPGTRAVLQDMPVIVLEHTASGTLVLSENILEEKSFDKNNSNDWKESSLRRYLNDGEFFKKYFPNIADSIGNYIDDSEWDLTADCGLKEYGTSTDKIGLLSCDQYRKHRSIIPNADHWWWLITPYTVESNGNSYLVRFVLTGGTPNNSNASYRNFGLRPSFSLKSDILVSIEKEDKP